MTRCHVASLVPVLVVIVAVVGFVGWRTRHGGAPHYTGFVEGEERVIRSEVTGRVLEVAFAEGDAVPADAVIATLDDHDIATRIAAKRQELAVLDADIANQTERIALVESTWERDRNARRAEVRTGRVGAANAERTFAREQELVKTGASTAQLLDDARTRRDQAQSGLDARPRDAGAGRGRGAQHHRRARTARGAARSSASWRWRSSPSWR